MTLQELQIKFMMLEDSYRKLEERIGHIETDLLLNQQLGFTEKVTNTSISLFLLRKDRERLASELGLPVNEYTSVKSFGEDALESLLYNHSDILSEFTKTSGYIEEIEKPVFNDSVGNKTEPVVLTSMKPEEVESITKTEEITESTFSPVKLDLKVTKKAEKSTRGRKSKAQKELEAKLEEEAAKKESSESLDVDSVKSVNVSEEEDSQGFKDLDLAMNMWG